MDKNYIAQLYHDKSITSKGVLNAIVRGWITIADAVEILGDDNAVETVRAAKLMEISKACTYKLVSVLTISIWRWKTKAISTTYSVWLSLAARSSPIRPMMAPARFTPLRKLRKSTSRPRVISQHRLHTTMRSRRICCLWRTPM